MHLLITYLAFGWFDLSTLHIKHIKFVILITKKIKFVRLT